jgi:tRNA threonylcarbamoyladenosine biosynthesis protein TsaB
LSSLDGIAVSVGPGSFTGLRIGISFAKGIAYAAGRPLVAVRTLEALAISAPPAERVAVCLDARKGEVYLAIYHRQNGRLEVVVPETAVPPEDAVQEIERHFSGNPGILVGDAAELRPDAFEALNRSRIRIIPFAEVHPRGGTIAALGHLRLEEGAETAPEALLPLYVRASEAERRASQNLR